MTSKKISGSKRGSANYFCEAGKNFYEKLLIHENFGNEFSIKGGFKELMYLKAVLPRGVGSTICWLER